LDDRDGEEVDDCVGGDASDCIAKVEGIDVDASVAISMRTSGSGMRFCSPTFSGRNGNIPCGLDRPALEDRNEYVGCSIGSHNNKDAPYDVPEKLRLHAPQDAMVQ
jgi:hypothetical protein